VTFNPILVESYRLIGFDNKRGAMADSNNVLEGGEVGSGHSMLAIFEIRPTGRNRDAVSYGQMSDAVAHVDIHYRLPEKKDLHYTQARCPFNYLEFKETESYLRFATSVALFGSMLHLSPHVRNVSWEQELALVKETMNPNEALHREFYELVTKAQKIYGPLKKRKRREEGDD
jgi:Ca-activated chloride channel family protein